MLLSEKLDLLVLFIDPPLPFFPFYFSLGAKCAQEKDDESLNDCEIFGCHSWNEILIYLEEGWDSPPSPGWPHIRYWVQI